MLKLIFIFLLFIYFKGGVMTYLMGVLHVLYKIGWVKNTMAKIIKDRIKHQNMWNCCDLPRPQVVFHH